MSVSVTERVDAALDLSTIVPRVNVLGVGVSAVNMQSALEIIQSAVCSDTRGYVCVSDVNAIMEAQRDDSFRQILNRSLLTTPDGMPNVWVGRIQGFPAISRVYGPDLMLAVCQQSLAFKHTHFLYGGKPGVAERLRASLRSRFPGIRIVGTYTPPFRPLRREESADLCRRVAAVRPNYFWVGIGTPKQDRFMAEFVDKLQVNLMIGVGAAFDFLSGTRKEPSAWVKSSGLQWVHRMFQEPGRLGKRYLRNNPSFVLKIAAQMTGLKRYHFNS